MSALPALDAAAPDPRLQHHSRSERRLRRNWTGPTLAALAALAIAGCENTGGAGLGPVTPPNVVGNWTGSFVTGGETFAANFTFSQSGLVVGGTAAINQLLPTSPIEGAVDQAGRIVMLIENDCEAWFGTFEVSPGNDAMEGLLQVDRSLCAVGVSDAGTLSLSR